MNSQWKEVVRVEFRGERFRGHALDLGALDELAQLQRIVEETAKALWRAENPDRERLPARFEERTRLHLRRIVPGSAVAPLEIEIAEQSPEPAEVFDAVELAHEVVLCAQSARPLPDRLPKQLVGMYAEWGRSLQAGESMEITTPRQRQPALVTPESRARLEQFVEGAHEAVTEVVGTVLEADVRRRAFQLFSDTGPAIAVSFNADQEETVLAALSGHATVKLMVRGRAAVSPDGKPTRLTEVSELRIIAGSDSSFDKQAPAIEDVLAKIAAEIPDEEWAKLPDDLSDNLDHYLYGDMGR